MVWKEGWSLIRVIFHPVILSQWSPWAFCSLSSFSFSFLFPFFFFFGSPSGLDSQFTLVWVITDLVSFQCLEHCNSNPCYWTWIMISVHTTYTQDTLVTWHIHLLQLNKAQDFKHRPLERPKYKLLPAFCVQMMMKWCLMSSDVSWHIRDKLWPVQKSTVQ